MVQLSDTELKVFESIASSSEGRILQSYLERLIVDAIDIRKITGDNIQAQIEARKMFTIMVEENLINKLKVLSGQKLNEEQESYS